MPRVYNKRASVPADAVYVGRPTAFGNPFAIGRDGDRDEVIERYRQWLAHPCNDKLRARIVRELAGRDLVCWCAPQACHADVILALANCAICATVPCACEMGEF